MAKEYETLETQKLLRSASAYKQLPNGEFVTMLAAQLELAEETIRRFREAARQTDSRVLDSERQALLDREAVRKAREEAMAAQACIALVRQIAKSPKGAKALAADLIKQIDGEGAPAAAPGEPSGDFPSIAEIEKMQAGRGAPRT